MTDAPIAIPCSCLNYQSPNSNTLIFITRLNPSMIALRGKLEGSWLCISLRNISMVESSCVDYMLVSIETAFTISSFVCGGLLVMAQGCILNWWECSEWSSVGGNGAIYWGHVGKYNMYWQQVMFSWGSYVFWWLSRTWSIFLLFSAALLQNFEFIISKSVVVFVTPFSHKSL